MLRFRFGSARSAAVSLIFATSLIPLLMLIGLAIDYGFYTEAEAQLDMAADAAALHAVRVAVQLYQGGDSSTQASTLGQAAGQAWFQSQVGNLPQAQTAITPTISVNFNSGTNQFTAVVQYNGTILTHFGRLFPSAPPPYPNWYIAGAATAVISTLTYNEFDFMIDNSSSMLIASDAANVQKMESVTPCSTQAAAVQAVTSQELVNSYAWYYNTSGAQNNLSTQTPPDAPTTYIPYGYDTFSYKATTGTNKGTTELTNMIAPPLAPTGECYPSFSTNAVAGGYSNECFYVPTATSGLIPPISPTTGLCTNGGGGTATHVNTTTGATYTLQNVPQAPCAFACHTDMTGKNDYYGVARANGVQLRFDVVQQALTNQTATSTTPLGVIPSLESYVQNSGNLDPVTVGVYYFNSTFTASVSPNPGTNSLAALQAAEQTELAVEPVPGPDVPDTDFPDAMTDMYNLYVANPPGSGNLPSAPKKSLFIVTDGMQDYTPPGGIRSQGPITTDECTAIKNMGVTIYVLYTTYYPLPNPYYLSNDAQYVEQPSVTNSLIYQALATCASPGSTQYPTILEASDSSQIGPALNKLLQSALNSPGRLSN